MKNKASEFLKTAGQVVMFFSFVLPYGVDRVQSHKVKIITQK